MKKFLLLLGWLWVLSAQSQTFPVNNLTVAGTALFSGQATFSTFPFGPTATIGDSSTKLATTAFVASGFAGLASPGFSGIPTAPTAALGTNSIQLATTAFVAAHDPCINILDFGGNNSAGTNNDTALNSALAAASSVLDACVYFPPGQYNFGANVTYTFPNRFSAVTIRGAGQETTQLIWAGGGGLTLNMDGTYTSFHVQDMTIVSGTSGSGVGLTLLQQAGAQTAPGNQAMSDVTRVAFRGSDGYAATKYWNTDISMSGVSQINFIGDNFYGPSPAAGIGVSLNGTAAAVATVENFTDCIFNQLSSGIVYGTDVQGVSVSQSNFTGDVNGISVPGGEVNLDQLVFIGNQVEATSAGISAASYVPDALISGNLFIVPANALAVQLVPSGLFTIYGNSIHGLSTSNTNGFVIGSSNFGGVITGNSIYNILTGIFLQSTSSHVNVQSNFYNGVTTPVQNSGTSNTVGGGSN